MLNHVALVQLQKLLQTVVLPGLQLVPANAAVTTEVWKVLQLLPYRQRFCMYAKWQVCLLSSQLGSQNTAAASMKEKMGLDGARWWEIITSGP